MEKLVQEVSLELLGRCNYKCWYCFGDRTVMAFPEPTFHDLPALTRIYTQFRKRGSVRTSTYARGTEPGLHPQTKQIVAMCAESGPIQVVTNLSIPVTEWLPGSRNCTLRVTIHPEAERDFDGFFARLHQAQELGYQLLVAFDSLRIERTNYKKRLAAIGIKLRPHKIRQPGAKSKKAAGQPALGPAGTACAAGYDRFFIRATTVMWRCTRNTRPLLLPLAQPTACARSAVCKIWKKPR